MPSHRPWCRHWSWSSSAPLAPVGPWTAMPVPRASDCSCHRRWWRHCTAPHSPRSAPSQRRKGARPQPSGPLSRRHWWPQHWQPHRSEPRRLWALSKQPCSSSSPATTLSTYPHHIRCTWELRRSWKSCNAKRQCPPLMHAFMALDLVGNTPAQLLETSNRNTDLQIW